MTVHKSVGVDRQEAGTLGPIGSKGLVKVETDLITLTGAVADNEVIATDILIPVDAKISSIKAAFDDLGTTGDLGIGFHPSNVDVDDLLNTNAVDEDCIAAAIDVNAAAVALTEYRFHTLGIETGLQKAWELAGLSAIPTDYKFFRLTLTASEATTAGGDIFIKCEILA